MNNNKQRFSLKTDENEQVFIRANQGHTMEVEDLELSEILHPEEAPVVVHGTYLRCLDSIKKEVCAVLQVAALCFCYHGFSSLLY